MSDVVLRLHEDWRKWRELSPSERRLLLATLAILPAVAGAIRLFGLRRICQALSGSAAVKPGACAEDAAEAQAVCRLVEIAARRGAGRPTCLARSVTLRWLLLRRGIDSTLRIGVRTLAGCIEAHAWVEQAGRVLNDTEDVRERFAPFEEIGLASTVNRR